MLRPAVVWFGEPLPENEWKHATLAAAHADLFLVVGTSALVYPAASLPWAAKQSGARLVEINPDPTPLSDIADCVLRGPASQVLGSLKSLEKAIHRNTEKSEFGIQNSEFGGQKPE